MKPLSKLWFVSRSLVAMGVWLGSLGFAAAATRTVTESSDNPASPAPGSLREVIQTADPGDTIEFAPSVTGTILLGGAELLVDKNLTIAGPGAASLAISGNGASRIFRINGGKVVSVSGLTIRDGQAPHGTDGADWAGGPNLTGGAGTAAESGGAIWSEGDLSISQCVFTGNSAGAGGMGGTGAMGLGGIGGAGGAGGKGGAIYQVSGGLVVSQTSFVGNSAGPGGSGGASGGVMVPGTGGEGGEGGSGGAIFSTRSEATQTVAVQLLKCSFEGNAAGTGGATGDGYAFIVSKGGSGGAVSSQVGGGSASNCTFADNDAGDGGTPVYNLLPLSGGNPYRNAAPGAGGNGGALDLLGGTWSLVNSTFSGNQAGNGGSTGSGGAIFNNGGNVSLVSCTIVGNTVRVVNGSPTAAPGVQGTGGGISGGAILQNTVVAGNASAVGGGPDVFGFFVSASHNFVGKGDGSTGITHGVNGDVAGTQAAPLNAFMGTLQQNGGGIPTVAPLAGSPVIDAGDDTLTGTDQRGQPRRAGAQVDIGAVESATSGPGSSEFGFLATTSVVSEIDGSVQIAVARAGNAPGAASVQFTTVSGTASPGTDYTTIIGTLNFGEGEAIRIVSVPVLHDADLEGDEAFTVVLSQPSAGSTLGTRSEHTVAIQDNSTSVISFTSQTLRVAEKHGIVRVTISRTGPLAGGRSVQYTVTSGTAAIGSDLPAATGSVEFAEGESSKVIEIPITKDRSVEGDELFTVTLYSPSSGVVLGSNTTLSVTLADKPKRSETYHGISFSRSNNQIGDVTVTTTAVDRFTAMARFAGGVHRFGGQFGPGDSYSLERTVRLRGFTGILRVTLRHGDAAGTLAGTATNPSTGDIHEFVIERATVGTVSSPVPGAGYYTGLLSMETPLSLRGYLTAKVRPGGFTTLLGALPDGRKVSQTAHVTGAGNLAIFLPAYGKDSAGYLGGSAVITASGPLPLAGSMVWEKPQGTPRFGGSAWEATPVALAGAPYVNPSGARVLDDFNATNGAGYVHFSGGSLAPLTCAVTIDTNNHARFAPGDAQKAKLTLIAKTGLFNGSFLHPDGKRHTFRGACIQQSGAPDSAQGFFLESDATGVVELTTSATP